ncbi:4-hydroxythreonine-4-phosphate dehydrogenase PdxA [Salinisphaera sp. LB1]|uniref:4-hydroxythreonine-4-phosphate dehydrogenase PdxA n=1 Tax=Salinisphaera sp. LB1 TaxID=2183911 RepID=UPI000D707B69|nr:4-hydroxythreonine-4-phosphate dehydrogenase PdxA [Salinisphaera sp. LB1]AWN16299.1 4-hydroxythreonine-4-phosphate dehydrogenase [Salinisphaera sp. LB1]
MARLSRVLLTPGEPAGIGPDLAVRIAQRAHAAEIVAVADPELLRQRADQLGLALQIKRVDYAAAPSPQRAGELTVDPLDLARPAEAGRLDPDNAPYVLATLDRAVARCRDGAADALVTGPVHKAVINQAGFAFTGHTGYLAARCHSAAPVMMLTTDDGSLRVALATVHIPLSAVPGAINGADLAHTLDTLHAGLGQRFGMARPRIRVAGLNPHAGENGYLGREEIDIIAPAIEAARSRGIDAVGPLPADTLFTRDQLAQADVVLAMYHDQGLPVIKHLGFSRTVNVSLGLPIVRTSVDHGTALELAGTDRVDTGSLEAALKIAAQMVASDHGA